MRRHTWSAVLCLLVFWGMFGWIAADGGAVWESIRGKYLAGRPEHPTLLDKATLAIGAAEGALNKSADRSHGFIQLFGGVQNLLGKRVIEDADPDSMVVRLKNGKLQFVSQKAAQQDVSDEAEALVALKQSMDKTDTPLLFMAAPSKVQAGGGALPVVTKEYGNAQMDQLISLAGQGGVDVLDLRETFAGLSNYDDYFFNTDHHWKPEGAFLAFQTLCPILESRYGISVDEKIPDSDQYEITVYRNIFLGSQGKRVGTLYGGVDDISLIAPKFKTNLTYRVPLEQIERTGDYRDSVIFQERVQSVDYFGGNPYVLYAGGDYNYAQVINHENQDGPYILLVRDSYACAMTPFLSLACGTLETVDLRFFQGSLAEYIQTNKPDLVLFLYTTATTNTPAMFRFF
jgi:hypothetical protein